MPNEEMYRTEREAMRLVLSCCGGVAAKHCSESSGQILMQSLTAGRADGVTEAGMCLTLIHIGGLGDGLHGMMIRILDAKTPKERVRHYRREIVILEERLAKMREGLSALEDHVREEEATDGAGS